jgi:hypothetical protein
MMLVCCTDRYDEGNSNTTTYKIAVIMPENRQQEWSRIADWALKNIEEAQAGLPNQVKLDIEWFDENSEDLPNYLKSIANDTSY